jgi:Mrp family chromosome partitioning ATPase
VLLVTRPGYTEENVLNEATQELIESEQIKFIGAVINGVDGLIQQSPFLEQDEDVDSPEQEHSESNYLSPQRK